MRRLRGEADRALREGVIGGSQLSGSRLCGAALRAAPRPGHERRAEIRSRVPDAVRHEVTLRRAGTQSTWRHRSNMQS